MLLAFAGQGFIFSTEGTDGTYDELLQGLWPTGTPSTAFIGRDIARQRLHSPRVRKQIDTASHARHTTWTVVCALCIPVVQVA